MDLIESLKKQERLREDYWKNVDYFLPIRLKWRAQMVRHFFHLFPENSILEMGAGSCQWTREISESNGNRNPICAAVLDKNYMKKTIMIPSLKILNESIWMSFPENSVSAVLILLLHTNC